MRIFYSVDVHGAETVWRKWISAIAMYECDCLMLCGDLARHRFVTDTADRAPNVNPGRPAFRLTPDSARHTPEALCASASSASAM